MQLVRRKGEEAVASGMGACAAVGACAGNGHVQVGAEPGQIKPALPAKKLPAEEFSC